MSELSAIFKLAVALFVYLQVKPVLATLTQGWATWGGIASDAAALIVSATLVHFVSGRVLARPVIKIDWLDERTPVLGPCVQLTSAPSSQAIQVYNVHMSYTSSSYLSKILVAACSRWGAEASVTLNPTEAAVLVREIGPAHSSASCAQGIIRFAIVQSPSTSNFSWIAASLQKLDGPTEIELECIYSIKLGRLNQWCTALLIPVTSSVQTFQVRSTT